MRYHMHYSTPFKINFTGLSYRRHEKSCSKDLPYLGDNCRGKTFSPTDIYLINSVTRVWIKLPSKSKFPDVRKYGVDMLGQEYVIFLSEGMYRFCNSHYVNLFYKKMVVLWSVPSNNNCLVVAIYGTYTELAFCKCNDKKWRHLNVNNYSDAREAGFVDIISQS